MTETVWPELGGRQLQYGSDIWELSGTVDVRNTGEFLKVEAKQVDDVRGRRALLRFSLANPPASLNPGNLGEHFDSLEHDGARHRLVVKKDHRTYRYVLEGLEYA